MKFIHLSDLHLGKRVNEFSMLEDQAHILNQIAGIIEAEQPQGVLIAGDVYDKPIPPAEAVQLFDHFLNRLVRLGTQVFVISGNHDSAERLSFGAGLMQRSGVYIAPVYDGRVEPVTLRDEHGEVRLYLLPFLKPAHVRRWYPEEACDSYTDALRTAVLHMNVDEKQRNVLITHQFVTGASVSESEELSVGGSENVDASVFDAFDYVALGHIHGPQKMGRETLRYCGTPLKYSFSEAGHHKSVAVVELAEKGSIQVRVVPLVPLRDLREIRGSYMDVTARSSYENTCTQDYVHIILTDEEDIPDAVGKLRVIYPNLMKLSYDNLRTRSSQAVEALEKLEEQTPLDLFRQLYELQNNQPMSGEQARFCAALMESIWEEKA